MNIETKAAATARDEDNALLLQGELAEGLQHEIGLRPEFATEWARRLTAYLRQRLGSQRVYVPAPSKAERDAAIYREFNGTNGGEVCQRHGVKRTRLYEILEEQRAMARERSPVSCLKTGQLAG